MARGLWFSCTDGIKRQSPARVMYDVEPLASAGGLMRRAGGVKGAVSARLLGAVLAVALLAAIGARGDKQKYAGPAGAAPVDDFFANQVWAKVGARSCLECHKAGGDAEDSNFVLLDPELSIRSDQRDQAMRHNRDQF